MEISWYMLWETHPLFLPRGQLPNSWDVKSQSLKNRDGAPGMIQHSAKYLQRASMCQTHTQPPSWASSRRARDG